MSTPTLLMEHLMLDPRYPELVERLRAVLPSHLVDQSDAATTDAYRTTTALAELLGGREDAHGAAAGDLPGWLRLSVIDAYVGFATRQASTCRHSPDPARPEPVLAAAWRPGLVTCRRCAHLFATGAAADRTCDGCGRQCAGLAAGDPIYPSMVQLGPVIFQYGTCTLCRPLLATSTTDTLPAGAAQSTTSAGLNSSPAPASRQRPRGARGRGRGKRGRS